MTKENIEFELNNGWHKRLIVSAVQNNVLHKDKQCIWSSKIERLGKRMIGESLDQEKPILWILVKELIGISRKVSIILGQKFGKLTPSKTKVQWKRDWDIEIAFRRFQLNLHKLKATLVVESIMLG
jgi:hypothetical protein